MRLNLIIPAAIILLLIGGLFSPLGQRLLRSGIFKTLPPAHLSSDLPAEFLAKTEPSESILINNINVIPMTSDTVLRAHDVWIKDGVIRSIRHNISPDSIDGKLLVVEGKDQYLIPGLTDMHTHINDDNNLLLFLANGVTMARNMSGLPFHLELKKQLASKTILGPELLTTTPILEGPSSVWKGAPGSLKFDDEVEIEAALDSLLVQQYDEVKVYHTLSREYWNKIQEVAARKKIRLVGHIPVELTIEEFAESEQESFEHVSLSQMGAISPEMSLQEKFELLADRGKWNCPTLTVYKYMYAEGISPELAEEYAQYVDPKTRRFWKSRVKHGESDYPEKMRAFGFFAARSDRILSGSDCINAYTLPGMSLHVELKELVKSGLSNYEALRTSTSNPALYLDRLAEIGTIEEGKQARLVMLSGNPLEAIEHSQKIEAVIMEDRYLSKDFLEEMTASVANSYE